MTATPRDPGPSSADDRAREADLAYEAWRLDRERTNLLAFDPRQPGNELFRMKKNAFEALDLPVGSRVLDYGAGTCELSEWLVQGGYRAVALDLFPGYLTLSRERCHTRGDGEPFYVVGDGERLPFAADSCEAAVCWAVLHHLPDPVEAMRALWHALRPGSKVLICEPNSLSPTRRARELGCRIQHGVMETSFYPWRLRRMLSDAGFEVTERPLAEFQEEIKRRNPVRMLLHRFANSRLFRRICIDHLIVATKP